MRVVFDSDRFCVNQAGSVSSYMPSTSDSVSFARYGD